MGRQSRPGARGATRSGPMIQGGRRGAGALPPRVQQAVAAAVAQRASGQHEEAASSFAQLATGAQERGMAQAATRFQLNAAFATYEATSDAGAAVEQAKIALDYVDDTANKRRVARRFARLVRLLADQEHAEQSQALEAAVLSSLGLDALPKTGERPEVNRAQRRMLPKRCAGCGASVKAADVDWEDEGVSCGYCDSDLM